MNKLSIACAILLVFGLMLNPAQAADLTMDFDGDGIGDTAWNLDPIAGETVNVDIYVDNWDYSGEPMFGVKMFLTIDNPTKVQLNFATPYDFNNGGIWNPAFCWFHDWGGGIYQLEVADFNCQYNTDKLKLFTIQLECNGEEDVSVPNIHLDANIFGTGTSGMIGAIAPGEASCTAPYEETAGEAAVELDQIPPPCTIVLTDQMLYFMQVYDFNSNLTINGNCNAVNLVWSDTCINGSIDPVTGVFTASAFTGVDELCSVVVEDSANPDACSEIGTDCEAEVWLEAG